MSVNYEHFNHFNGLYSALPTLKKTDWYYYLIQKSFIIFKL